jgi:hypothetical protein
MASFVPNPNLLAELEREEAIQEELHRAAERVAATARRIAPVGDAAMDDHPGEFRESISAEGTNVVADDPNAVYIIFGTSHSPPHDTLRRAAEMEGLHVMKER